MGVSVGLDCKIGALYRLVPIAGTQVNMRWHVDEMSRIRRKPAEPHRSREAAIRIWTRLNSVDVVMICSGVVRVAFHYPLKHGDDLHRALGRLTIERPKLP